MWSALRRWLGLPPAWQGRAAPPTVALTSDAERQAIEGRMRLLEARIDLWQRRGAG